MLNVLSGEILLRIDWPILDCLLRSLLIDIAKATTSASFPWPPSLAAENF